MGDKAYVSATERIPRNMIDKFQCETLDYVILKSHFKHDLFSLQTLYELDREASQRGAFELDLVRSIIKQVLASSLFEIPERFRAFEKREIENGWVPSDST